MKVKIHIGLWSIIGLLFYIRSSSNKVNSTQVKQYLNVLCETNDDCLDNERTATDVPRRPNNPCCWGKFNYLPDSMLDADMIYGTVLERIGNGRHRKTVKDIPKIHSYTKCLLPMVTSEIHRNKYMYVVDPPEEGCIATTKKEKPGPRPSCSPDVKAARWGNFYPVYSRDKKINFINENCAVCHGAEDTLRWKVFIVYGGRQEHMFHYITKYFETLNSSDVSIMFETPNDDSKDYGNVCLNIRENCLSFYENFLVPVSINISKPEIIQACEQGPTSLYIASADHAFKNVFCAICNRRYSKISNENVQCELSADDAWKSSGRTFVSLLKDEYIDGLDQRSNQASGAAQKMACLSNSKAMKEINLCRAVLCPTLQVRYHDGKCDYPIKTMFTGSVIVPINITSYGKFNATTLYNLTATDIRSAFERFSPWSNISGCLIDKIGYRTDKNVDSGSEFFITINCQMNRGVYVRAYLQSINYSLTKPWILWIDERIEFKQEILGHGSISKSKIMNDGDPQKERVVPSWATGQRDNFSLQGLSVPIWDMVSSGHLNTDVSNIKMNKLFYCDNVYLMPDDYTFHSTDIPIYLIRNDKYLLTNEYYTYTGDDGNQVLITCLEDTDFALIGSQNAAPSVEKYGVFVILYSIFMYYMD